MIGTIVSHYKVLEKLGEGGMGVVYKAQDLRLDRFVALKFLPPHLASDEEDRQRLIQEAKAASTLDHPNICTIYEIDETTDGRVFIAMAAYEGSTLDKKIRTGPLKLDEARAIAIQLAEGLHAAHEKGIIHRDVKSGNVMVTERGQVKVMDFGLARTTGATQGTRSGVPLGTVPYMSPEQARGDKVDQRTDVWSVGVVIYEMVSGRLPFRGEYNEATVYAILNEDPPPLTSLRTDVPVVLERIVNKALRKDRAARYQHLDEMVVDLKSAGQNLEHRDGVRLPTTTEPGRTLHSPYASADLRPTAAIAVLPFKNLSPGEEQEYFCDGMTEAITTDLSRLRELVVLSPSAVLHYKGRLPDYREIREELRVRYVLEGSVQRSGEDLRVSAQLTDADSGVQLWAERFDRTIKDVFSVQDHIADRIVGVLRLTLGADSPRGPEGHPTASLEAYDLYLRARYHHHRRNIKNINLAIPLLERATSIDPDFAEAFALLGSTYTQKSFFDQPLKKDWEEKAFVTVEKALSLDPNLAEAYVAKGNLLWTPGNHFPHENAVMAYRRAIELKPSYDEGHEMLGFVYYHVGLLEEGLAEFRKALQINPGSAFAQSRVGVILLYMGRYEEALAELKKGPSGVNPQIVPTQIAIALFYLGRHGEADELLREAVKEVPGDPFLLSAQAMLYAAGGKTDEAREKIRLAVKKEKTYLGHFHHAAYNIGVAHALMNDSGESVRWLRKAIHGGFPCYPFYARDPHLDVLRREPPFEALMKDLQKQWVRFKALC